MAEVAPPPLPTPLVVGCTDTGWLALLSEARLLDFVWAICRIIGAALHGCLH